jgi:hypothetical protein
LGLIWIGLVRSFGMAEFDERSIVALPDKGVQRVYRDKGPRLGYFSAILWSEDAREALNGKFLGDNYVTWWIEHLAHEEFKSRRELLYLHPGAMFLLQHEKLEDLMDAFKFLQIEKRQVIFIPLSNDPEPAPVRPLVGLTGAHRSLLVWVKREDMFYHYDSGKGAPNGDLAFALASKLWALMLRLQFRDKGTPLPPIATPRFQPQKKDCESGVYMLFIMYILSLTGSTVDMMPLATPVAIFKYRQHTRVVLVTMIEEYQQAKGETTFGVKPQASTIMPGSNKHARPPRAEDLESVVGDLEDFDDPAAEAEEEELMRQARMERVREGAEPPEIFYVPAEAPPPNRGIPGIEEGTGSSGGGGGGGGGGALKVGGSRLATSGASPSSPPSSPLARGSGGGGGGGR